MRRRVAKKVEARLWCLLPVRRATADRLHKALVRLDRARRRRAAQK